jgi:hypothetical protein
MLALTFYAGRWCGIKWCADELMKMMKEMRKMTDGYDETAKLVNEEIAKLGDVGTFADLKTIDKKLGLPSGSSFEMGGFSDYFASMDDD